MRPARRLYEYWRICFPAAELIQPGRIHAKNRRIPVDANFCSPLERMRTMDPAKILLELIQVAIGPENRSCRLVVGLVEPVGKGDARLRVIARGKKRCAANVAERSVRRQVRGNRARVVDPRIPLMIEKLNSEVRIDRRLVGIR